MSPGSDKPFDPQVLRAMVRWPNVPAVFGWLRLDRRGRWWLIDRGRPDFDPTRDAQGSLITSPPILAFIARNYASDAQGRWFWQNGPQRVFVELEAAPYVLRVMEGAQTRSLVTHTGLRFAQPTRAILVDHATVLLSSIIGCGVVHDLDLAALDIGTADADALVLRLGGQSYPLEALSDFDTAASILGYERHPRE